MHLKKNKFIFVDTSILLYQVIKPLLKYSLQDMEIVDIYKLI